MVKPSPQPDRDPVEVREIRRYAPPEIVASVTGERKREGPLTEPRPPIVSGLGLWWLPTMGLLVGLGFIATDHMLRAGASVAASLWLAAALRAFFPEDRAGGLVVRAAWFDVALLVLGGLVVAVSAFTLDLRDLR